MDQFTGEIFDAKKKYEKKRGKVSTLSGYINTFFSEKFGIQARIAEFGCVFTLGFSAVLSHSFCAKHDELLYYVINMNYYIIL